MYRLSKDSRLSPSPIKIFSDNTDDFSNVPASLFFEYYPKLSFTSFT